MQNKQDYYSFLLRSQKNNRIRFRRVGLSKNLVHFGTAAIFLFGGISILGVGAVSLARTSPDVTLASQQQASLEFPIEQQEQTAQAFHSGGPEVLPETPDDAEIDQELKQAVSKLDPAFIPDAWAREGKINNEFGFRRNPFGGRSYEFHPGLDIDGDRGDSVFSPSSGTVIKAGYTGGYGNMIEIDHGNGITTRYGHLSKIEVTVGETVTHGQLIGLVGSTGRSTGPHLHYELRLNDRPINPRHLLPAETKEIAN